MFILFLIIFFSLTYFIMRIELIASLLMTS